VVKVWIIREITLSALTIYITKLNVGPAITFGELVGYLTYLKYIFDNMERNSFICLK
jgi:hypothetical protein